MESFLLGKKRHNEILPPGWQRAKKANLHHQPFAAGGAGLRWAIEPCI
jgi:hypothetical protein